MAAVFGGEILWELSWSELRESDAGGFIVWESSRGKSTAWFPVLSDHGSWLLMLIPKKNFDSKKTSMQWTSTNRTQPVGPLRDGNWGRRTMQHSLCYLFLFLVISPFCYKVLALYTPLGGLRHSPGEYSKTQLVFPWIKTVNKTKKLYLIL